jgi:hypothetical protein
VLRAAVIRPGSWFAVIRRVRRAYRFKHRRPSHLLRPRRYTDKIQWRKLFDRNPIFAVLCDKLAARDFIADRVGAEYLAQLLWHGNDPAQIPFDALEPPFVVKSTHGSGHAIIVGASQAFDRDSIRATARAWLEQCYGTVMNEPGYIPVPRRLVIERQIMTAEKTRPPERRMFVFDGRVGVINTVIVEDGQLRNGAFHTPAWERLPWYFTRDLAQRPFPRPKLLDEMISVASRIGAGVDHVRVDLYDCGDRFWVGETTVYPWSGLASFIPDNADYELGELWQLRNPIARAAACVWAGAWATLPTARAAEMGSPARDTWARTAVSTDVVLRSVPPAE